MPKLPRPYRDDVLIAVAWLVGAVGLWTFGLLSTFGVDQRPGAVSLIPLVVMCGAELLRRMAPVVALAMGTVALAADLLIGSLLATVLMFSDVIYASVLYGPPRLARRVPPASILFSAALTLAAVVLFRSPTALVVGVVAALASIAPAFTGAIVRDHRDEAAAERLRAEQTALLAEIDRTQAVNAERARMARELHDMVANHLSAIAIHSTAALSLREDPVATRDALGVIRENSVQGLAEMRRLIDILRHAGGGDAPDVSPTLQGLDALLERAGSAAGEGFRFVLRDERDPGTPPAPVEMAAYRVVQEAVTNALKHAAPGTVTVALWCGDGPPASLTVCVHSPLNGVASRAGPRAPGSGAGLIGMRERVELLGGRLETGPVPVENGRKVWEVRAELPVGREFR